MEKNQIVVHERRGALSLRNFRTYGVGATVGGLMALSSTPSFAAASLDFSGATAELDGVKTAVVGIIGTLLVLVGIGIAWAYFKRTAK